MCLNVLKAGFVGDYKVNELTFDILIPLETFIIGTKIVRVKETLNAGNLLHHRSPSPDLQSIRCTFA